MPSGSVRPRIIDDGKDHEDAAADLRLITLAGQAGLPTVAKLLDKSLAEEEVAEALTTQLARERMSQGAPG